jgi:hypothetical protein
LATQQLEVSMSTSLVKVEVAELPATTEAEQPRKPKQHLSFTLVDGYLRGEHRCRFELHATGCRDLRKVMATQPSYELIGVAQANHEHCLDGVIAQATEDLKGTAGRKDIWVQPCCNIKRMRAIGRA